MTRSRIAIVHERWTEIGGSENVVEQLALEWPRARVFVPFADPASVRGPVAGRIVVSPADRLHRVLGRRSHAPVLPVVPWAMRRWDFGDAEAVIVSHHALAVSSVAASQVPTVAYVHSPARWAWDPAMREHEASSQLGRFALAGLAKQAVRTELEAASRITRIVANSAEVAKRIRRWWGRESTVVHPPVDVDRFSLGDPGSREDFFLVAGRLVPYKRADIAVRAAREAGVPLVVAGEGRLAGLCRSFAGPETRFLGRVADGELRSLFQRARALVMPGLEDFGIVPVEAMACGTPVIALGAGGALDTVVPGLSGQLVEPAGAGRASSEGETVSRFAEAMRGFRPGDFDPAAIRRHAEGFSTARFRLRMRAVVDAL
ncbi:glycosyltransferase [Segniliparus rugosus]|uniref:Glycosyltransferase family 4 protein n=1 Tax=Segniliparus rugosus (strain ATCC BAA-974 / DSM 45345 / CCUG 50838 / CIP 108380 / JCM 13579 / CDC 945) TaxID=679197 RepID=E5XNQ5_SEGRC|nr:glycosyltransferase [Segniliparus rugosus]EFV14045.1 hypothetical protein HMPREF9336_01126 [Segniliparus rugosus ATCC BAA-974]